MMSEILLGKVLASAYDDDGFLCVQIETFSSAGTGKTVGWFHLSNPHGMQVRPLDPEGLVACQAFYWYDGTQGYAMLANDPRTQSDVSIQLQKGEAIIHNPLGVGFVRMRADGEIALFTTSDNTPDGRSVSLAINSKGLVFNFPYGRLTFDDTGFHVLHNSGARIDLGAVGGLPSPLDQLSSYVSIKAAVAKVEGVAVKIGPRGALASPTANATETLVVFEAVATALDAVAAALTAIVGVPVVSPAGAGPAAAAAAAIVLAQSAVASAATLLPSLSTAAV